MQKRYTDSGIILLIIIVVIIIATTIVLVYLGGVDNISQKIDDAGNIIGLVAIEQEHVLLSAQLVLYNTKIKRMAMLDIPNYLGIIIVNDEGNNLNGINTLYDSRLYDEYKNEVERIIDRSIDFRISIDADSISNIVDVMQGIGLPVTSVGQPILASSKTEMIHDGALAEQYVTTYIPSLESIELQTAAFQTFIESLLIAMATKSTYLAKPEVAAFFYNSINADISENEFGTLLSIINAIDRNIVSTWNIQGDLRTVLIDDSRKLLLFPYNGGDIVRQVVAQILEGIARSDGINFVNTTDTRIKILNGTAINGLARDTKILLEQYGYTIVEIGNYTSTETENTIIIDHSLTSDNSTSITNIIDTDNIINEPTFDSDEVIDVTIILGADFRQLLSNGTGN